MANFYSLLENLNLFEEEEDMIKCLLATQLDEKRLEREMVVMNHTLDEIGSAHEVDDTPLNAIQEHSNEDFITSEQDIEMEYLKELKRVIRMSKALLKARMVETEGKRNKLLPIFHENIFL